MEIRDVIFIIIAIVLAYIIFKLFIWLLPIVIILLLAFFIYTFLNQHYNQ